MIGIIGAMEMEIIGLQALMEIESEKELAGTTFYEGRLAGARVVLARSGVGKVHAAMCAQAMIDHFAVTAIIHPGVAGAIADELEICDIVVATDLVQHDFDTTSFGAPPGKVSGIDFLAFPVDKGLSDLAFAACSEVLTGYNTAHRGRIATGDQFIADRARNDLIWDEFGAYCAEMEGAAIAQVCYLNGVKLVVIRSISDKADGSAKMDFADFAERAAYNSARIVTKIIKELNNG